MKLVVRGPSTPFDSRLPFMPLLAPPERPAALEQFLEGGRPGLRAYRARVSLEAAHTLFGGHAFLHAATGREGGRGFTWRAIDSGGCGLVLRRVLVPALEAEPPMWAAAPVAPDFTPANYEFADAGLEGDLARVEVSSRRKDSLLTRGFLFLSPGDAGLVRVTGQLAGLPRIWVSQAEVTIAYGLRGGVRVPVTMTAAIVLRLAGRVTCRIRYDYEMVNGAVVLPRHAGRTAADAGRSPVAARHVARSRPAASVERSGAADLIRQWDASG